MVARHRARRLARRFGLVTRTAMPCARWARDLTGRRCHCGHPADVHPGGQRRREFLARHPQQEAST